MKFAETLISILPVVVVLAVSVVARRTVDCPVYPACTARLIGVVSLGPRDQWDLGLRISPLDLLGGPLEWIRLAAYLERESALLI